MKSGLGLAILPSFDIYSLENVAAKKLAVNLELEYGIGCLKNNSIQRYIDKLIQIAESEIIKKERELL